MLQRHDYETKRKRKKVKPKGSPHRGNTKSDKRDDLKLK